MAVSREHVFREALELEQSDRAELAAQLIDSLDPGSDENVEQAWMQELDRRVAELNSGDARTIPWDVVRQRLRRASGG
jgi:putative addiction module component (TIGR02574 family)